MEESETRAYCTIHWRAGKAPPEAATLGQPLQSPLGWGWRAIDAGSQTRLGSRRIGWRRRVCDSPGSVVGASASNARGCNPRATAAKPAGLRDGARSTPGHRPGWRAREQTRLGSRRKGGRRPSSGRGPEAPDSSRPGAQKIAPILKCTPIDRLLSQSTPFEYNEAGSCGDVAWPLRCSARL